MKSRAVLAVVHGVYAADRLSPRKAFDCSLQGRELERNCIAVIIHSFGLLQ